MRARRPTTADDRAEYLAMPARICARQAHSTLRSVYIVANIPEAGIGNLIAVHVYVFVGAAASDTVGALIRVWRRGRLAGRALLYVRMGGVHGLKTAGSVNGGVVSTLPTRTAPG